MKDTQACVILIFIVTTFCFASCHSDTSQIEDSFSGFKSAILNRDGNEAFKFVDNSTVESYSQILGKVKHCDSLHLEQEPTSTKFEVLKIRHMINQEVIHGMNGKRLFTTLIDIGISGYGNIDKYSLGDITIKKDSAEAQRLSNNKLTPFIYRFIKEGTTWKIRMASSNSTNDIALKQLAIDEGMSENDYIFKLLKEISGKKPSPDIWRPFN